MRQFLLVAFIISLSFGCFGSERLLTDSSRVRSDRLRAVILGESVMSAASLGGLYFLWYADYPASSFHWFNDNNEWLLMDKIGHATSSYYVGKLGFDLMRWTGQNRKKSIIYGGGLGFAYLSVVEIMDGFSQGWGASWGDLTANAAGSALFITQELAWQEQRFLLKWSFHRSGFAAYRPEVLGSNVLQEAIKDYNGQTYWLSGNLNALFPATKSFVPDWFNVAFGYGAEGMIRASSNPVEFGQIERYRQYYFSFDVDLTRIKSRHPAVRAALKAFGFVKVPFPALGYDSRGKLEFLPLYF